MIDKNKVFFVAPSGQQYLNVREVTTKSLLENFLIISSTRDIISGVSWPFDTINLNEPVPFEELEVRRKSS